MYSNEYNAIALPIGRRAVLLGIAAAAVFSSLETVYAQPRAPLVAAASGLRFALEDVLDAFRDQTGIDVRVTYGSSGNLARQIMQGAPFDLFMSADERFVLDLAEGGMLKDEGALYAIGRIVLFAPPSSELVPDEALRDLGRRLDAGSLRRLAIANPEHAPYGRAAEQALRAAGLWEFVQPRLVLGENVSQAAQFAASGQTDGGIIAYSLALAPQFRERGRFALIPADRHEPLRQRMALTARSTPQAEALYDYLRSAPAREILAGYGFALPDA